jgi:hypothetical protein
VDIVGKGTHNGGDDPRKGDHHEAVLDAQILIVGLPADEVEPSRQDAPHHYGKEKGLHVAAAVVQRPRQGPDHGEGDYAGQQREDLRDETEMHG